MLFVISLIKSNTLWSSKHFEKARKKSVMFYFLAFSFSFSFSVYTFFRLTIRITVKNYGCSNYYNVEGGHGNQVRIPSPNQKYGECNLLYFTLTSILHLRSCYYSQIRISISSICYIRDIFPRDCFKKKEYGSIDIHQLQGGHKDDSGTILVNNYEAFLLTQWLEKGVFSALESEYLSSLTFALYSKHPITKADILLETYEFKVSCPQNEPAKINDVALLSKDSVKTQAALFIRSLTEFASTLDVVPSERWITLQLKVNSRS